MRDDTTEPNTTTPLFDTATRLAAIEGVVWTRERLDAFERLGLETVGDLLGHFPRRYEDRRSPTPISGLERDATSLVRGVIASVSGRTIAGGRHLLTVRISDGTGELELVWFQRPQLGAWLKSGMCVCAHGKIKRRRGIFQMASPEFEVLGSGDVDTSTGDARWHMDRIVPVYPLSKGVYQRFLRSLVARVLEELARADGEALGIESTPYDHFFPDGVAPLDAYRAIHFPEDDEEADRAKERFAFDERFRFATRLFFRRSEFREGLAPSLEVSEELDAKIRSVLPFELSDEQNLAVEEITADLRGGAPMYRLLQGDVGTGKTVVALYALLAAVRGRQQGALPAPTEVLAAQHHATIVRYLTEHPAVRVELLTGSTSAAERRRILAGLASGAIHLVIGTHALVSDAVTFSHLGVIVIDEQHRFGVRERQRMRRKGDHPHLLVMTATPIPRSLAMTCYGDLDLSMLRQRPGVRQRVETKLVSPAKRRAALGKVRDELLAGRRAFFIFPLVEESENLELPAAVEGYRRLAAGALGEFEVGLLHGRLDSKEKAEVLERFRSGEVQVLVATVVVEVGIDIPEASVAWLEDASRFGLAQLHQLRGRVGRGGHRGYCFVATGGASRESMERLRAFARIDDGFELAEADLKLRGPGDYLGVRQSGLPQAGLGHPLEDIEAFRGVQELAGRFWGDPNNAPWRERWAGFLERRESGARSFEGD